MHRSSRLLCAAFAAACTPQGQDRLVDSARQYQMYAAESVQQPSATSVYPTDGTRWVPYEVGPGRAVTVGGKRTWLVELRGWLTRSDAQCNAADPDWHWWLEVDPVWADSIGMPVAQLLRAGNMVNMVAGELTGDTRARTVVGVPNVNIELQGWIPANHPGGAPPAGWQTFGHDCVPAGAPDSALWEFNPTNPLAWQGPLQVGDYVRMFGALVTDAPHVSEGFPAMFFCRQFGIGAACRHGETEARLNRIRWGGNRAESDTSNAARWTEMHPPDIIAVLPGRARAMTLMSVAVSAENCLVGQCETSRLDVEIPAPQPMPAGATAVGFTEEVIAATNFRTILEGRANSAGGFDGATVTTTPTGIRVQVAVRGQPGYGAHGRFGAFYRVFWQ